MDWELGYSCYILLTKVLVYFQIEYVFLHLIFEGLDVIQENTVYYIYLL